MKPQTIGAVNALADDEDLEVTREGLLTGLLGKAKEAAGELVGNDRLASEGRLQQAQVEAESQADADSARENVRQQSDDGESHGDKTD